MPPVTPKAVVENNRNAWNAGRYDAWVSAFGGIEAEAARIVADPKHPTRRILPYLETVKGRRICCVQGSHGRIAVALAVMGAKAHVIDFSEENRRFASDLAKAANVSVDYDVCDILKARSDAGLETVLITIHSFTPIYYGQPRSVEIGILHDDDTAMADAMLSNTQSLSHRCVERNQPYGPDDDVTHTLKVHAIPRQINNVMLEVRNDLLHCDESIEQIGELLFRLLSGALQHNQSDTDNHNKGPV